ncbi:MAG: VWA domain-containing protein [Anaerolineae bacterium]|nr:VWA domain-containing protein [Anaerolineae bacterium]
MAEQRQLLDAFDDCVDRLNAGDSLDDCLRDYPQHAERLRSLLGVGQLVYRAQVSDGEVSREQADLRVRLDGLLAVPRKPVPRRRVPVWGYAVAASLFVIMGGLLLFALLGPATGNIFSNIVNNLSDSSIGSVQLTASPIMLSNPTTVAHLNATQTQAAAMPTPYPVTLTVSSTVTATTTPASTATPSGDTGIVATSVAVMSPAVMGTPAFSPTTIPLVGVTMQPGLNLTASPTPLPVLLPQQIIPLNAGEIDDNARWDTYLEYRMNYLVQYAGSVRDVDVTGRQIILVTDEQGLPVIGARVSVYAGQMLVSQTRTYATGQTLFFPNARMEARGAQSYRVVVEAGQQAVQFTLDPNAGPFWAVELGTVSRPSPTQLDVLFLLDSTGSMADEIAQLQNNILAISVQIAALGNVDVRYGLVTYRDRGDEYISRVYDFVPDVTRFQADLSAVRADAGGDGPESLNQGLHDAVQLVSWRGADTVKLIFLVADAPPHLDYPQDYDYSQEMFVAAGQGIKIHPIASSGLTPDGEFIFRQIAQVTMGRFLFLTYQQGGSGAPGEDRPDLSVGEPADPQTGQQGDYTVERLDELVLRLITDELAALNARANTRNFVIPPLTAVTAPAAQSLPPTWTPTPMLPPPSSLPPPTLGQPVPPTPTATLQSGLFPPSTTLSWPLLVLLIAGAGVLGYTLRPRAGKAKRKRFEVIED